MKKIIYVLFSAAAVLTVFSSWIQSDNGKAGYTNSTGESNCTNCHSGPAVNTGGGQIYVTSNIPGWVYTPGQTYTVSVIVKQTGKSLFGVGLEILKGTSNAGTIVITNAAKTQIKTATVSGKVRNNLVHTFNGGLNADSAVFTFNWIAPATNIGAVKIWFTGIAANNNGSESGDLTYKGSKMINVPALTVSPAKLTGFNATLTVPSAPQSFTASGLNLMDSLRVTAPSEYQVSLSSTTGWKTKIAIARNGSNAVPPTTIYVRYKPKTAGYDSLTVKVTSANAIQKRVTVVGHSTPRLASDDQHLSTRDITLAPNPVLNTLSINAGNEIENATVTLFDIMGNKIQTAHLAVSGIFSMDVSGLKAGVYICSYESEGLMVSKRFIKQ